MKYSKSTKKPKSLGFLRKVEKTKPKSPDLTGHLTIQSHTLKEIVRQFKDSDKEEVPCNLAAWRNTDKDGETCLAVELSPWFIGADRDNKKSDVFDALFSDDEEED